MKLNFDNSFLNLPSYFYTQLKPTPVQQAHLIHLNKDLASTLGLDIDDNPPVDFADFFSGNKLLPQSTPFATVYSGHQFGQYVPQLGDGRALFLGEVIGRDKKRWDIQLKGAGKTPYSRMGDGRAVLRSTIREYLCSESMHFLGIPTTRALCIVGTNEKVYREQAEPGAILTRVAESHIRFGHFEYFFYTNQFQALRELADYVLKRHYPGVPLDEHGYLYLFEQTVRRTAQLMAQWQAVGFCHGVMNTDNMSIIGLTIDYGPFGFLDTFDTTHICNSSDYTGRYAYNQQPGIAYWNLSALAYALSPLVAHEKLNEALQLFEPDYTDYYLRLFRAKLGLDKTDRDDKYLIADLLNLLEQNKIDYTSFFRELCTETIEKVLFSGWLNRYRHRLDKENQSTPERLEKMNQVNPAYILRNHLAQIAIDKAYDNNYDEIDKLNKLLQNPYEEKSGNNKYTLPPDESVAKVRISCSS